MLKQKIGAGNGAQTRDLCLGKAALYQLSYSRTNLSIFIITKFNSKVKNILNLNLYIIILSKKKFYELRKYYGKL